MKTINMLTSEVFGTFNFNYQNSCLLTFCQLTNRLTDHFSSNIAHIYIRHTYGHTQTQTFSYLHKSIIKKIQKETVLLQAYFLIQKRNKKLFIILVFCFTFTPLTPHHHTESSTASKGGGLVSCAPNPPPLRDNK